MKGILLDSDYVRRGRKPHMCLYVKTSEGTVTCIDESFRPYVYAVTDKPEEVAKAIEKIEVTSGDHKAKVESTEVVKRSMLGKKVTAVKVFFRHPDDVTPLRHEIRGLKEVTEVYEFDISLSRRYLIDNELVPMGGIEVTGEITEKNEGKQMVLVRPPKVAKVDDPDLNLMSFDIEVYCPSGSPRADRDQIIMMSMADSQGFRRVLTWKDLSVDADYVEVLDGEREMLERFVKIIEERDVDVLLGYNSDLFDFPYIRERAEKLNVKINLGRGGANVFFRQRQNGTITQIPGRVHVDVYTMVSFLARIGAIRLISYTLESVYKHVTGKEKPDIEYNDFNTGWEKGGKDGRSLVEYSISDADATLELGKEFMPLLVSLSRTVRQSLFDVNRMSTGQLVEWLLISEAYKAGEIVPPRRADAGYFDRDEDRFEGAYVKEPTVGLHENLAVFDFRSLYPSIIVSHNIDPATLNCDCCKPEEATAVPGMKYKFCKGEQAFIPRTLERIIRDRAELKKKMKTLDSESREYRSLDAQQWALKVIANSFYGMLGYTRARWYSRECAESVTSFGRQYIKDTIETAEKEGFEVIYGDTDSLFCKIGRKSDKDVYNFLDNINKNLPGMMELELEGFYERGIFITKKRYAMTDKKGKLVIKGLEFVRRDWAPIAKKTQQTVLEAILRDGSAEKAAEIIQKTTRRISKGDIDLEDLVIHTKLKMALEEYRAIGPHVAAAKRMKEKGKKIEPGMMISYIITKGTGNIGDRAIPVEDFENKEYDPDYYIGHQVLPAVMRIMEVLGYDENDLRYDRAKQTKLGSFTTER